MCELCSCFSLFTLVNVIYSYKSTFSNKYAVLVTSSFMRSSYVKVNLLKVQKFTFCTQVQLCETVDVSVFTKLTLHLSGST
jgi:hypothetical protein